MTNRNKTKGSAWERAIVECLRAAGWPHAERRIAGAALDRGDIAGLPGVVIEAKNSARLDLAGWVAEAETERVNDNAYLGVVWHKRRGKAAAADGYVTMTGAQFVELLGDALLNRPFKAPAPDAETPPCPGAHGQPPEMHELWGCSRCNPITRMAAEGGAA